MKQAALINDFANTPILSSAENTGSIDMSNLSPSIPSPTCKGSNDAKTRRRIKGLKTLVVEDSTVDQKVILNSAEKLGLKCSVVSNGVDAIESLKNQDQDQPFDLVLLDYKLPNLDGLTASKHIKKELELEHLPKIFLLSAYHKDEIFSIHDEKTIIDGFLTKPVLASDLESLLQQAITNDEDEPASWPFTRRTDDELLQESCILLAEDNLINQRVAVGILNRKGVEVVVANNGQEAINIINSSLANKFDAILMDMDMPIIDGYEATRQIKATQGFVDLPIIALTAHNSPEDRQKCLDTGMSDYLTKPIKPDFLYETILSFLR